MESQITLAAQAPDPRLFSEFFLPAFQGSGSCGAQTRVAHSKPLLQLHDSVEKRQSQSIGIHRHRDRADLPLREGRGSRPTRRRFSECRAEREGYREVGITIETMQMSQISLAALGPSHTWGEFTLSLSCPTGPYHLSAHWQRPEVTLPCRLPPEAEEHRPSSPAWVVSLKSSRS
jgi:hypothetical protein